MTVTTEAMGAGRLTRNICILLVVATILMVVVPATLVGCGGTSPARSEQELLAQEALAKALEGDNAGFVSLVAPSYLENARAEMPDVDDEVLGGILIAGFLGDIPFRGIQHATYDVDPQGDKAVVHVWGSFVDSLGMEMGLPEAEAVRIPLVNEGGRWFIDLLDL